MKKVLFTSILLLSAVSFGGNIYAQGAAGGNDTEVTTPSESSAGVEFKASEDGKTLTISGHGDLTSYTTTDWSAKVFTDKAVGFVFTDDKGTKVNAKESYNSGKTYYQAEYKYSLLYSGVPKSYNNGFAEVTTSYSWKDVSKLANLYAINWNNNGAIGVGAKVEASTIPNTSKQWTLGSHENLAYYIVSSKDIANTTLSPSDYNESSDWQVITMSEFIQQYVAVNSSYTIYDNQSLFVKHNESADYEVLVANKTYTYKDGDQFYKGTANYIKIENNEDFFGEKHSDYIQADNKTLSFNELLLRKITEGSYEKVVFENKSSESCLIDATTIQNILFPNSGENTVIKELDLGQATLNNLSATHFGRTGDLANCKSLETLTLPLTNKTIVKSEKTNEDVKKMVVPTNVIPEGYGYMGHHLKTIHVPEGYDRVGDEAFKGRYTITNVTLPTSLQLIGASAFENCTGLTSIVLNEGLENIGEKAFASCKLKDLKFPSTLKIINDGAFYNVHVTNLKLNAGLEFIGNSAFALARKVDKDAVENVVEIPASVKYIGPAAFDFRTYQDVYFYGEKAPLMPLGDSKYNTQGTNVTAFYAESLMGFGGFDKGSNRKEGELKDNAGEGYANRENYKKSTGAYFCILHFPKGLTPTQQAAYSDINREYKTVEEGKTFHYGKTDTNPDTYYTAGQEQEPLKWYNSEQPASKTLDYGFQDTYLGRQYVWPSQEAWLRSYIVSSNGYNWDGVTPYRPKLTADDLATLAYAGYKQADVTDVEKGEYTLDDLQKIAHLGTRQFVLANADVNVDKEEDKEPEYPISLKTGKWWTLCVPFNMTKKQVLETFGEDTQLCLFSEVERHTGNGHNSIVLKFTQDVLNHSTTDSDGNKYKGEDGKWLPIDDDDIVKSDDEVVVWAHESYMIKPMKGKNSDKEPTFVVKNYTPVVGNPLPTVVEAQVVKDPLQEADYSNEYRFIGNYLGSTDEKPVVIPQYSYIYAKTGSDPTYKFRFYTGTKATWSPNKSIVQSHDRQGGYLDYKNFFGSDKSTLPQSAKQASIFGEEDFGETTGIDNVTIIAGSDVLTPIFTLDGKMVSVNGSVEGLAKGVYVKAGKKFVVK